AARFRDQHPATIRTQIKRRIKQRPVGRFRRGALNQYRGSARTYGTLERHKTPSISSYPQGMCIASNVQARSSTADGPSPTWKSLATLGGPLSGQSCRALASLIWRVVSISDTIYDGACSRQKGKQGGITWSMSPSCIGGIFRHRSSSAKAAAAS